LNEALEEAGLIGRIVDESIGCYSYTKKGKKRNVVVMLMEVVACRDAWKESGERQRRWASIATARELLDRPNLLELLQVAVDRIRTDCPTAQAAE
jgi:phosphohistidine phosphatase